MRRTQIEHALAQWIGHSPGPAYDAMVAARQSRFGSSRRSELRRPRRTRICRCAFGAGAQRRLRELRGTWKTARETRAARHLHRLVRGDGWFARELAQRAGISAATCLLRPAPRWDDGPVGSRSCWLAVLLARGPVGSRSCWLAKESASLACSCAVTPTWACRGPRRDCRADPGVRRSECHSVGHRRGLRPVHQGGARRLLTPVTICDASCGGTGCRAVTKPFAVATRSAGRRPAWPPGQPQPPGRRHPAYRLGRAPAQGSIPCVSAP